MLLFFYLYFFLVFLSKITFLYLLYYNNIKKTRKIVIIIKDNLMNENIYKLEIKMDDIKKKTYNLKVLILLDKISLNNNIKIFKRLFDKIDTENINNDNLHTIISDKIDEYDFIISTPFHLNDTLITDVIKLQNNKKHIILLNDKVTQYDILSMNKSGNVLFLGNNLEVIENIDILDNYTNIINLQSQMQKEFNLLKPQKKEDKREKILIYNSVVVVQNILKKVFQDIKIRENRYDFEKDNKGFYINLNKNKNKIKIVILTSENPPFDEVKMISKISSKIKILYVTSTKDSTLLKELERLGVDDFIYKPFEFENIIEKIRIADDVEQKVEHKINLFSLKELIEKLNNYSKTKQIDESVKNNFKEYFKFLQS